MLVKRTPAKLVKIQPKPLKPVCFQCQLALNCFSCLKCNAIQCTDCALIKLDADNVPVNCPKKRAASKQALFKRLFPDCEETYKDLKAENPDDERIKFTDSQYEKAQDQTQKLLEVYLTKHREEYDAKKAAEKAKRQARQASKVKAIEDKKDESSSEDDSSSSEDEDTKQIQDKEEEEEEFHDAQTGNQEEDEEEDEDEDNEFPAHLMPKAAEPITRNAPAYSPMPPSSAASASVATSTTSVPPKWNSEAHDGFIKKLVSESERESFERESAGVIPRTSSIIASNGAPKTVASKEVKEQKEPKRRRTRAPKAAELLSVTMMLVSLLETVSQDDQASLLEMLKKERSPEKIQSKIDELTRKQSGDEEEEEDVEMSS